MLFVRHPPSEQTAKGSCYWNEPRDEAGMRVGSGRPEGARVLLWRLS